LACDSPANASRRLCSVFDPLSAISISWLAARRRESAPTIVRR
jgi:hypothetical protein